MASKHVIQTRTGFLISWDGIVVSSDEHLAQKTLPQFLQWCRRSANLEQVARRGVRVSYEHTSV